MGVLDQIRELQERRDKEAREAAVRPAFSIAGTASRAVAEAQDKPNLSLPPDLGYLQGLAALNAQQNPWYQNFLEGVGGWMRSVGRAIEHPFADEPRRKEMAKEAAMTQHFEEAMPSAYKVGRQFPPFAVPPVYKGASLLPQMAESAITSTVLNVLDYDRNPTYGGTALNALGAAAAPMVFRGLGNMVPGGVPGSARRNLPEEIRTNEAARAPRIERLRKAGIRVRPSERTGSSQIAKAERRAQQGKPGAQKVFDEFRQEQLEKLNSHAAKSLGESPLNIKIGEDLLEQARTRIKGELDDVVDNSSLTFDKQFHVDLNQARNLVKDEELEGLIENSGAGKELVDNWIMKTLNERKVSGWGYQALEEDVRAEARLAFGRGDRKMGLTYAAIGDALDDAFERQMGKDLRNRYKKAKQQYSSYIILSGRRVKDVVDANGNLIPKRVAMALDQNKNFRDRFSRGQPSHDLSLAKDYALVVAPPGSLPISEAKGIPALAEWFIPGLFGGTIPAKAYLKMGSSLPSPMRSAATGRAGSYVGGRLGGTEMESAIIDAVLAEPARQATPLVTPPEEDRGVFSFLPSWGQSLR